MQVVPAQADGRRAAPARIECFSPATRARLGSVLVDGPAEVRAAVARARTAQDGWRRTSFPERRRVLARMMEHCLEHADELCELVALDCGKTREHALLGEIWPLCEKLRWTIAHGERHLSPERVSSGILGHKRARLELHPLGVMGAIVPWNYPLQNLLGPVIPALMAGNGMVCKPSEHVAFSSGRFARIVHEALLAEGQPPELVAVVNGWAETGQALLEAGVDGLVFIGSVANGRRVLETAARTLTPVVLELGGKDPFIVCDDADLDLAVPAAMAGTFINCGQNCVASERILVHEAVAPAFEARVAEAVRGLRQGPPLGGEVVDLGAMATPLQLEIVERLVDRALEDGARLVAGGRRVREKEGEFFAPTVLADVRPDMQIMQEEIFGPVMLLCRVRDDDEAIAVANGTAYGLSSSVFSRDAARARRIAAEVKAGMAGINEYGGMTYMAQDLPFGGVKASGYGRMNGREGLRACCNVKAVLDDRWPLRVPSRAFPVGAHDYQRAKDVLALVYHRGLAARWRGLAGLLRALVGRR
jgi:acyl-CoA reductase-like NAD-dependent aldehyde dehydrogenase